MKEKDPVWEFPRKRGCPGACGQGGAAGAYGELGDVVRSVEEGYSLGLDDYLNDMDGRQLIEEVLHIAPAGDKNIFLKRIRQADGKDAVARQTGRQMPLGR